MFIKYYVHCGFNESSVPLATVCFSTVLFLSDDVTENPKITKIDECSACVF